LKRDWLSRRARGKLTRGAATSFSMGCMGGAPTWAALVPEWYTPFMQLSSKRMNDTPPSIEDLERIVAQSPKDARAIVALANAYWLSGRGPDVVGELASRAIAADPDNRAGWHLWALSESNPRDRVTRWQQVSARFPEDDLARVNVADNAAALAGAEHDYDALDLAIATYQRVRDSAERPEERLALDEAITKLRGWRF
jgi:hypothetical protein